METCLLDLERLSNQTDYGNKIVCACPACRESGSDKKGNHLTIYKENGAFSCVLHPRDKDHNRIILNLVGKIGQVIQHKPRKPIQPTITYPKYFEKDMLIRLIPDTNYWEKRGISKDILSLFGGGVAHGGKLLRRYVIPIYDEKMNIVGFSGRLIVPPREDVPPHKHIGTKSQWVFPIHLNKQIIRDKKEVILTEGIGDILTFFECNIKNVLCLWGVKVSKHVIKTLIALDVKKIIIATNNENSEIGNNAARDIYKDLSHYFDLGQIEIRLPSKKDFNDMLIQDGKAKIIEWYNYETR